MTDEVQQGSVLERIAENYFEDETRRWFGLQMALIQFRDSKTMSRQEKSYAISGAQAEIVAIESRIGMIIMNSLKFQRDAKNA